MYFKVEREYQLVMLISSSWVSPDKYSLRCYFDFGLLLVEEYEKKKGITKDKPKQNSHIAFNCDKMTVYDV